LVVFLAGLTLLLLAGLIYWLLVTTEGAYLGHRVVIWLYDVTAQRYDDIKEYDAGDERLLVTRPVLRALQGLDDPHLLDVATGTGRVPIDLLQSAYFKGHIAALDGSERMLAVARDKLAPYANRVELLRHPAVPLPFSDDQFDCVTCLEALEFFPSDRRAVAEMARVLRRGCTLFVTRRCGWEGKAFLHRYRSKENMQAMLEEAGLTEVQFHPWQVNYDLVTARKL
jgi:ubiquinone/menaquinone biosynthesis C-methylase UbiE